MFRPFLPCGIAYGSAYALPMLCLWLCLWHFMLFFRRKASRRVVCIVPYRRGACQPVSAEFRRHLPFSGAGGVPPCRGGLLRRCRRGGRWRCPAGGVLSLLLAYSAFSFCFSPYPPSPRSQSALPRRGRGRPQSLFRRGLRPRHPCTEPLAALTDPARTGARRGDLPSLLPAYPAFGF